MRHVKALPHSLPDSQTIADRADGILSPEFTCCVTAIPAYTGNTILSLASTVSGDGTIIGGTRYTLTDPQAVYWQNNTLHSVEDATGYNFSFTGSIAHGLSHDGTTLVGTASAATTRAFLWNLNSNNVTFLAALNDVGNSAAMATNNDGTLVAGKSISASYSSGEATLWNMQSSTTTGLGVLAGGSTSIANALTDDGSIIVGTSESTAHIGGEAFYWDGAMHGLGVLAGGTASRANAVSTNGNLIAGQSDNASAATHAVLWNRSGSTMQDLGTLSGDTNSAALGMSRDGATILGYSDTHAMRWTQGTGMQSIANILATKNVDLTGWDLREARGISDDGEIIVGGAQKNGDDVAFLANLATGGVTTPQNLATSMQGLINSSAQVMGTSANAMTQALFTARHINAMSVPASTQIAMQDDDTTGFALLSPAAGSMTQPSPFSVYMLGGFGIGQNNDFDNHDLNGTIGISTCLTPDITVGIGLLGANSAIQMAYSGESRLNAQGISTLISYAPPSGWQGFATLFAADLNLDITRGYQNGAGLAFSGAPDGKSLGAGAQLGYLFPLQHQFSVMPFVDIRWSRTHVDAYTESGGPFPASFGAQDSDNLSSRLGAEFFYPLNDQINLNLRTAWGHRIAEQGLAFSASSSGVTQTLGLPSGDRDWLEAAIGSDWQFNNRTRFSAELAGRSGNTQDPQLSLTLGVSYAF